MRERLTGTLVIGYTLIMLIFSFLTLNKAHGQYIHKTSETLPAFTYYTLDGKKFTEKDLNQNTRLMIVYFNPHCEVCQEETKEIMSNIDYFKGIQIVMISPNTQEELAAFSKQYNLASQILLLQDPDDVFYKQFKATGYPSLYLYDQKKNLITNFESQTDIEEIKEAFGPNVAKK